MESKNEKIVGLALCAFGNVASQDIARDLSSSLEDLMRDGNPYIRKKAHCCAIKAVQKLPEISDGYFKCAINMLEDTSQPHGVMVAAVQLLTEIMRVRPKLIKKMRKHASHITNKLKNLLLSSYNPDHDIGGVCDPFLQVNLLSLLRIISVGMCISYFQHYFFLFFVFFFHVCICVCIFNGKAQLFLNETHNYHMCCEDIKTHKKKLKLKKRENAKFLRVKKFFFSAGNRNYMCFFL